MRSSEWAMGAGLLVAFSPALLALARVWSSVDYYSHGFLVPLVSGWIAWQHRRVVARCSEGSPLGLGVLALSVLLYGVGLAATSVTLQGLGFVLAVTGALCWFRGVPAVRALAFPLFFLIFMVPLPDPWIAPIIVNLQLFVSSTGVDLLHGFGLEVARQGNVLVLPGGERLFVAEACSGITSIITLTPLAVLLAYYTGRGTWRRVLLVASVVPIAMLWNFVRVVATVWFANAFGAERATEGVLHESAGLLTFVAACFVLIAFGSLLRRTERPA